MAMLVNQQVEDKIKQYKDYIILAQMEEDLISSRLYGNQKFESAIVPGNVSKLKRLNLYCENLQNILKQIQFQQKQIIDFIDGLGLDSVNLKQMDQLRQSLQKIDAMIKSYENSINSIDLKSISKIAEQLMDQHVSKFIQGPEDNNEKEFQNAAVQFDNLKYAREFYSSIKILTQRLYQEVSKFVEQRQKERNQIK